MFAIRSPAHLMSILGLCFVLAALFSPVRRASIQWRRFIAEYNSTVHFQVGPNVDLVGSSAIPGSNDTAAVPVAVSTGTSISTSHSVRIPDDLPCHDRVGSRRLTRELQAVYSSYARKGHPPPKIMDLYKVDLCRYGPNCTRLEEDRELLTFTEEKFDNNSQTNLSWKTSFAPAVVRLIHFWCPPTNTLLQANRGEPAYLNKSSEPDVVVVRILLVPGGAYARVARKKERWPSLAFAISPFLMSL